MKTVQDLLKDLAKLYEERNAKYGDNYKYFGSLMVAIFPRGIELRTVAEFNRFALFLNIAHKLTRYARAMPWKGHADSLDDLAIYAMMAQEMDRTIINVRLPDTEARGG